MNNQALNSSNDDSSCTQRSKVRAQFRSVTEGFSDLWRHSSPKWYFSNESVHQYLLGKREDVEARKISLEVLSGSTRDGFDKLCSVLEDLTGKTAADKYENAQKFLNQEPGFASADVGRRISDRFQESFWGSHRAITTDNILLVAGDLSLSTGVTGSGDCSVGHYTIVCEGESTISLSLKNLPDLSILALDIVLSDNAKVNLQILENLQSKCILRLRCHLMRDSNLNVNGILIGSGNLRLEGDILLHQQSEAQMNICCTGNEKRKFSIITNQAHLAPHCNSYLNLDTIMEDESQGVFNGYIRVKEAAHKTDGYQKHNCLVLSPKAHIDSIPNLEIKANDVKCSHGATISQPSAGELFYLASRGIKNGQKLLRDGMIMKTVSKLPEELKAEAIDRLELDYMMLD